MGLRDLLGVAKVLKLDCGGGHGSLNLLKIVLLKMSDFCGM